MEILPATSAEDIALCADIWLEASIAAHDFIPAEFWRRQRPAMEKEYLPASRLYLACRDGVPGAFAAVRGDTLEALFTRPEYWGKGFGTALLRELFAVHGTLRLAVYKQNHRARNFYKKMGFVEAAENICPHTGQPEIHMRRISA